MSIPYIRHQTELSANVVLLCRFLRKKGFPLGATEEADALTAISQLPIHQESYFKQALKAILTKNRFQFEKFDKYYSEFWQQLSKAVDSKTKEKNIQSNEASEAQKQQARFESLKDWLNLNPSEEQKSIATFSDLEVLTKKDFADLSEDEMRLMMRLLKRLAKKIAHRKSRLRKSSKSLKKLDLKRTIRLNLRKGGEFCLMSDIRNAHGRMLDALCSMLCE